MVKILKSMLPKHKETLSPWIHEFVEAASTSLLALLPQQLSKFPSRWPFPRGDLYHWIPLLNRFDYALEAFCTIYGLRDGPQIKDFSRELLSRDWRGPQSLEELGYQEDGDLKLMESILDFSRMLLENCGNRSIYASSPHLSDLLNSTSLSLLASTLQIGSQLARRYQASYKRMAPHRHANAALLANHYNINLDRVEHLAQPFVRTTAFSESPLLTTPATPSSKGKEKLYFSIPASNGKAPASTIYANDLVSMVRGSSMSNNSPYGRVNLTAPLPTFEASWDEWGDVRLTYYANHGFSEPEPALNAPGPVNPSLPTPVIPTPIRRTSTLGHQHGQKTSRLAGTDDSFSLAARNTVSSTDETQVSSLKVVEIPRSKVKATAIHQLLKETLPTLPQDSKYEFLTKLRVANALTASIEARRQMLAVRILAITNLAYIHTESVFIEKVLKQDGDEPRRLQLIYQLADLIHPPADGYVGIPRRLQTIAMSGLEALAQHQAKFQDICTALNTNVSHGVLLYIVRKAVAEMAADEPGENLTEKDEWRGALFQLLSHVATLLRAGSEMVTAGLVPILVEVLTLRTGIAERNYPKILQFLDAIIFNVRDAPQILVNADGLEAIQDLIVHEVKTASKSAGAGEGMPYAYRSPSIDYQIPYFQQQSIKWLFKFIHHMMTTAGGYGGNLDRLLRNLIDSSPLLGSLREIIGHTHCFGSTVWTNAVGILNDFINNEPTSFAVIAEAGLSRELLQSVTGKEVKMPEESKDSQMQTETGIDGGSPTHSDDDSVASAIVADDAISHPPTIEMLEAPRERPLAQGILPSAEAISIIPQAFGAICLNTAGMRMFQSSSALENFFEIFESPKHVQCMENDPNLATNLGSSFDELVRHHPPLKTAIMNATLDMVARVAHLCKKKSSTDKIGTRLWATDANGKIVAADDRLYASMSSTSKGKGKADSLDTDVEMSETMNDTMSPLGAQTESVGYSMTPFVYAVATFLSTMFSNIAVRVAFMEKGGIEYVLDLAELPTLPYDFADDRASRTLHTVIALLAEQKPHLVLPSLVKRAQAAVDNLTSFAESTQHKEMKAYFARFVSDGSVDSTDNEGMKELANGTRLAKAFVNVLSLTTALHQCFQTPVYNHRTSGPTFNQMNLADYYNSLVRSLGAISAASIREDFILQKGGLVPAHWKRSTRTREIVFSDSAVDDLIGLEPRAVATDGLTVTRTAAAGEQAPVFVVPSTSEVVDQPSTLPIEGQTLTKRERESSRFQNFQTLRYLLSKTPPTISLFFQSLGKALISKRNLEPYQRQSHVSIADALAETVLLQLSPFFTESSIENYTYWIVMLGTVKDLLINVSRHSTERPFECCTLVLQAFKERNGFDALNHMLEIFTGEIRHFDPQNRSDVQTGQLNENLKRELRVNLAALGTKHILTLYLMLVGGKSITEASQTSAMISRSERDRTRPDFFSLGQFLVEIRMAVLPTIRRLWESDLVEKATHQIPNRLIDIIRTIALADSEQGAFKRVDKATAQPKPPPKPWKVNTENLGKLIEASFSEDLAKEALFRCNNTYSSAVDYCKAQVAGRSGGRNPIPQSDLDDLAANGSSRSHTGPPTGTVTPVTSDHQVQLDEPLVDASSGNASNSGIQPPVFPNESMDMSLDSLLESDTSAPENSTTLAANTAGHGDATPLSLSQQSIMTATDTQPKAITVDDLNEERATIRGHLVDRCLDVINDHAEVTFEICDLIKTVVDKSDDPASMRKETGETLVQALMSFAEEDVRVVGKKVAAYAHLLALMLQEKNFYNATVGELKEILPTLLTFVKLSPTHSAEEPSPWIAHILLIIETLLCEDAQPYETEWKLPVSETSAIEKPALKLTEPAVSREDRISLFNSILEILFRIGKDESLALALLRVLVILTRNRNIAQAMGEKKNIQRLFVMTKQLAGATSARLQSPLMLILRHIIEDDETIKQVMRSEIKAFFESPRPQRHIDVATYIRQLSHLVIRAPESFVEVTNEMVKLSKWTPNTAEAPGRQQIILQDRYRNSSRRDADDVMLPNIQSTEPLSIPDAKPSTESSTEDSAEKVKPIQYESNKTPVVENPDGVIHFLLWELLNYKDVEDKDTGVPPVEKSAAGSPGLTETAMVDVGSSATTDSSTTMETRDSKKQAKQEFKAEEHPIYIYRCFLLQCLTELLSCYNRTKIEFINFRRSAPPLAMTPAKPRSGVVNYLLYDLIPVGTLDHSEAIAFRKRLTTSSWADSVLTALLSKTGEQLMDRERDSTDAEDEPDLFFVRKFVLDNILKAYKDASSSNEPLDTKYARMLSLADLMNHIMAGKENHAGASDQTVATRSGHQLRRIMFEKGYIAALTGSIADLDLNFPGAKRAVKHILRPLKVLTQTAIELSDSGKVSLAPGQTDEEEIASASSASEIDDEREETPDLFRNSTLGMFEPGRDNDSSSDSDDVDEEMYEGEYDDEEMDYEEEMAEDDDDNISDEDEELGGMGEIEGIPGDHGVDLEVILEGGDDEDEDDEDQSDEDEEEESEDIGDDDEHIEIVDEDGNSHPLGEGDDEDDWQSEEDEEEDYEGIAADEEEAGRSQGMEHIARGAIGHLVRALGGEGPSDAVEMLQRIEDETMDADAQRELENYLEDGQDEEEDEEDEEDIDDEEGLYDDYPVAPSGMTFEWGGDAVEPPLPMIISHRAHRSRHGITSPFSFFPGGPRDPLGGMLNSLTTPLPTSQLRILSEISEASERLARAQNRMQELRGNMGIGLLHSDNTNQPSVPDYRNTYRSHRPGLTPRGDDDGRNPLLQRSLGSSLARDGSLRPGPTTGPLASIRHEDGILDIGLGGRGPFGESPVALLNDLINSLPLPGSIARHGHALHFHVTGSARSEMSRDLQAMFGMRGLTRFENRRETTAEPGNAAFFTPQSTSKRWTDEAKLLFGAAHPEKAYQRILCAVMAVLIPPALKAEIEARKIAEEQKKKREEEERIAKEKKEAEEKAAKDKKEAEEREAAEVAEKARAEEAAAAGDNKENATEAGGSSEPATQEMEGIEVTEEVHVSTATAEAAPTENRPRVLITIRGNEVDITDLDIDADFLRELPEDIREEVITSEVADRRSQAAAAGAEPSEIDQEFLDALPSEIRDEIIQQERQDRRRREREEQRRQAALNGGPAPAAAAQEMDAASILATLPPDLRRQVIMEQNEETLAQLPPEYVAQARAGMRDLPLSHVRSIGGIGRPRTAADVAEQGFPKPQRRSIVQMLDKAGVATLLRLMFVFQQDSLRSTLYQVLQNISENRYNRGEVISTLLHILQDGSADMTAVERSFAHLSLRAKQPKEKEQPKTPQPPKRSSTGVSLNVLTNSDISPLMVVQQCLSALIYLCRVNPHVPSFFLTEHESTGGLKRSTSRKGKGKDTKASKYALNSLLTLLDRKLIMESSSVMESLSDLLSRITSPLQALERKQKEADEAKKLSGASPNAGTALSAATPDPVHNTEQVPESIEAEATVGGAIPSGPADSSAIEEGDVIAPANEHSDKQAVTIPKDSEQKKLRPFIPPVIPEINLNLVINIFVARECSARTFRETLSTIKNLSCIPGAKAIFGRELVRRAKMLAEIIVVDLEELLPQILKASTGTDIQGVALAKFSPSGSDQSKLLRVLTALDHLFDSKNSGKKDEQEGGTTEPVSESSKEAEKHDLLAALYDNSTFGLMWDKLSACLGAIRQREHMLNVATILLPLIESLMVVCKNTTLKDASAMRPQITREISLTSPPPDSRMENLFFNFTEEHRKILNELVRHTPKLMSGTFSLLVKNPKVLEFDNKRNYFTRSIHNRNNQTRQSFPPLQLSVRRDQVFHDSFQALCFKTGEHMKFGKLSIRFHGEEGVDAGGVTREWFQVLSRQMFDPGYALFIPVSSDRTTFHPNHMSSINPEHLMFFKFIGRVIGKALYEGRVLDCHFSRAVYKRILGKSVSVKDMESLDPDYYKSLVWMLENDITDIITETFSVDNDKFGVVETVDLIEDGRNVLVTQGNKQEYVRLMVEFKLTGSVQEQLDHFLKGFHEIIPAELVAIFNEQELELLISGLPEIDVDDWKSNTEYHNYTSASPQIQWFWRAVRSFDKEERAKLLQFVTGTSKVPLNGFKELEGMNGFSRFNIHRDYGNKDRLPSSHTCFNQLDLPEYEGYETLRQQMLTAITAGSEYFGFA